MGTVFNPAASRRRLAPHFRTLLLLWQEIIMGASMMRRSSSACGGVITQAAELRAQKSTA